MVSQYYHNLLKHSFQSQNFSWCKNSGSICFVTALFKEFDLASQLSDCFTATTKWREIIYSQISINSLRSPFSPLSLIISWQACADSWGGFRVMNLYSTTQNNSHKGTSGDFIVFNKVKLEETNKGTVGDAQLRLWCCMCSVRVCVWWYLEDTWMKSGRGNSQT